MTIFLKLKLTDIKEEIKKLEAIKHKTSLQERELETLKYFEQKEINKSNNLLIKRK